MLANFPGECEVLVKMRTRAGTRELRLGREYRVAASIGCAELDSLLLRTRSRLVSRITNGPRAPRQTPLHSRDPVTRSAYTRAWP